MSVFRTQFRNSNEIVATGVGEYGNSHKVSGLSMENSVQFLTATFLDIAICNWPFPDNCGSHDDTSAVKRGRDKTQRLPA